MCSCREVDFLSVCVCVSSDFRVLCLRVMMQMTPPKMAVRTTTSSTAAAEIAAGRT